MDIISMIKDPRAWSNLFKEVLEVAAIQWRLQDFKMIHVPKIQNRTWDAFANTVKLF